MASRTPRLCWLWYTGWFVDSHMLSFRHAGFQALWKNYVWRIWDLSPSPNTIHVLGCSYWDPPKGADSCIQATGNTFKFAVRKIEQSTPSREEKSMTRHLAVVTSRMLLMNAESLISLPDQQQLLHSHCRKPSCHDHVSAGFVWGISWQDIQFMYLGGWYLYLQFQTCFSARAHLRGHTYQGRRSNSISSFAGTKNICMMDVYMSPKPSVSFLTRMHMFHKLRVESSREIKMSCEKAGLKSAQCWG